MKKRRIIAVVFVLAAITFYQIRKYYDGGFENPDVEIVTQEPRIINGVHFKGLDSEVPKVIDSIMIRLKDSGKELPFIVHTVSAFTSDHKVDMIIGAIVKDSSVSISMDFAFFAIPKREVIRGHVKASGAYVGNIDVAIEDFRIENGLETTEVGMSQWSAYSKERVRDYYLDHPIVK